MPPCKMDTYVILYVIDGDVEVSINDQAVSLREGQCLITEPSTISMKTESGVKIMGIQITCGQN